jgi:hypothetical protein
LRLTLLKDPLNDMWSELTLWLWLLLVERLLAGPRTNPGQLSTYVYVREIGTHCVDIESYLADISHIPVGIAPFASDMSRAPRICLTEEDHFCETSDRANISKG